MNLCAQIKERLSIREAAAICGIALPEKDGIKFASPFREDRHPSCEVYKDHIVDRSSNERFDSIATYAAIKGLSTSEAVKALALQLKLTSEKANIRFASRPRQERAEKPAERAELPALLEYTDDLAEAVAKSRQLSAEAVQIARSLGTITFAKVCGFQSWVMTDRLCPGWEARRIDGLPYPAKEPYLGERKSHAKGKGIKSWPMGICPPNLSDDSHGLNEILLVEGMPDYLAAIELIIHHIAEPCDLMPAAMLGKSADIAADALPLFCGRKVVIVGHPDARDRIAAWTKQLVTAGAASVLPVRLKFKDLNDFLTQSPHRIPELVHAMGFQSPAAENDY